MFGIFGLLKAQRAQAHCDIPCGIYDPVTAKIAAQTAQKMVQRIQALEAPGANATPEARRVFLSTLARYVAVKEEHAETCKKELRILWADYFRPEHVTKYPSLHTDFWNAQKLAGQVKQKVDLDAAKQLVESVDKIAATFWETKNVKYADPNATVRYGT